MQGICIWYQAQAFNRFSMIMVGGGEKLGTATYLVKHEPQALSEPPKTALICSREKPLSLNRLALGGGGTSLSSSQLSLPEPYNKLPSSSSGSASLGVRCRLRGTTAGISSLEGVVPPSRSCCCSGSPSQYLRGLGRSTLGLTWATKKNGFKNVSMVSLGGRSGALGNLQFWRPHLQGIEIGSYH